MPEELTDADRALAAEMCARMPQMDPGRRCYSAGHGCLMCVHGRADGEPLTCEPIKAADRARVEYWARRIASLRLSEREARRKEQEKAEQIKNALRKIVLHDLSELIRAPREIVDAILKARVAPGESA